MLHVSSECPAFFSLLLVFKVKCSVPLSFRVSLAETHRADGEAKLVAAVAQDSYVT